MKTSLYMICLSVLLGLSLCSAGIGMSKEYSKGEAVYRNNCSMCHLIRAENPPLSAYYKEFQPKDFTTVLGARNLSEEKIKSVLMRGQGNMRPITLSADDYKALVDYLIHDLKQQRK